MSILDKTYKSRKTILEMMKDRGYNIEKYENFSIHEIEVMVTSHSKSNKDISPIDILLDDTLVKYIFTHKIRISNLTTLADYFIEDGSYKNVIFIVKDKINIDAPIEEYFTNVFTTTGIFIQYFYLDSLTFNITKHSIVPQHYILSDSESSDLIKSLHLTSKNKLPKITKSDPVSKYYGLHVGQICRITRPSETTGITYYYRICIS